MKLTLQDGRPPSRRVQGGVKAQAMGAAFENLFAKQCQHEQLAFTRIPDGCRQVSQHRLIRIRTPWDWVITSAGRSAFIDTKTTLGATFPSSSVTVHQALEMQKHQIQGSLAGYVIWLRKIDRVFFISATDLLSVAQPGRQTFLEMYPKAILLGTSSGIQVRKIFEPCP